MSDEELNGLPEEDDPEGIENEESFAELLDAYGPGMNADIRVGDKINVTVIGIGEDTVFVDAGSKIDGIVEKAELLDDDGNLICREGDRLDLFVVAADEADLKLSRALSGVGGIEMLRNA